METTSATLGILHLTIIGFIITVPALLIGLIVLENPMVFLHKIKEALLNKRGTRGKR